LPIRCDIVKEEEVEAMAQQVLKAFGQVDILVNNAVAYSRYANFLDITLAAWDHNMNVNVRGPFLCCRAVLPNMMARRKGSIVNITTSASGRIPRGLVAAKGLLLYYMTKAALERQTTWLADELADYNIAVNALHPGTIKTEGGMDVAQPGYDWNKSEAGIVWRDPTPEYLGPPLIYLAQQTANTFTGRSVRRDEFRVTWP